VIHNANDLISVSSEARRKMSQESFQKARELRNAIDNELYTQALKGQNQCLINSYKYHQDSDPCGYIIDRLIDMLEEEGFQVEYIEVSDLLIIKW
jgi:hypothetical protein